MSHSELARGLGDIDSGSVEFRAVYDGIDHFADIFTVSIGHTSFSQPEKENKCDV